MKKKKGFDLRTIGKENVLMADGTNVDFTHVIHMNETAAYIWKNIKEEVDYSMDELTTLLQKEYEVSTKQALSDIAKLVEDWKKIGIVQN